MLCFRSSLIGGMTLKLLPLLGAIGLQYAWVLPVSIVRSSVVSPAKIKALLWAEQKHFYRRQGNELCKLCNVNCREIIINIP